MDLKFKLISIGDADKFIMPIILIIGFILSLWTYCIFVIGVTDYIRGVDLFLVFIGCVTHVVISLAVTKACMLGLKTKDPALLKPWIYTKIVEGIFLFTGSVLCSAEYYRQYVALTAVGIIFLMIGLYITLCMWKTYKQMIKEIPQPEEALPEKPPSYESFTNQTLK